MVTNINRKTYDFWFAYHNIYNNTIPGALWYKSIWENNTFDNLDLYDHLLQVIPCSSQSWVIQVGAHLGLYVTQSISSRLCRGISIEGNSIHIPLIQLTNQLNNHNIDNKHIVLNVVGHSYDGVAYFDTDHPLPDSTSSSSPSSSSPNQVKAMKLDTIVNTYLSPSDHINILIIDAEGSESNVLLGASNILQYHRVSFLNIEVWFRKSKQDILTHPGLELLTQSGYHLYFGRGHPIHHREKYKFPKSIPIKKITSQFIQRLCQDLPNCLKDVFAFLPSKYSVEKIFDW